MLLKRVRLCVWINFLISLAAFAPTAVILSAFLECLFFSIGLHSKQFTTFTKGCAVLLLTVQRFFCGEEKIHSAAKLILVPQIYTKVQCGEGVVLIVVLYTTMSFYTFTHFPRVRNKGHVGLIFLARIDTTLLLLHLSHLPRYIIPTTGITIYKLADIYSPFEHRCRSLECAITFSIML